MYNRRSQSNHVRISKEAFQRRLRLRVGRGRAISSRHQTEEPSNTNEELTLLDILIIFAKRKQSSSGIAVVLTIIAAIEWLTLPRGCPATVISSDIGLAIANDRIEPVKSTDAVHRRLLHRWLMLPTGFTWKLRSTV